jgi:hypothetical protein
MSRHRQYGSQTSFLDLLFNSLLAFVAFFIIALQSMNEKNSPPSMEIPKAEFLVTLTWPSGCNDDIDLWMSDSLDSVVYFQRKEDGLMHLDRDDVGNKNDEIRLPDGTKFIYKENREVITIRGIVPGEYCINLHLFSKRDPGVTPALVKVEKMNPYKTVFVKEVQLQAAGDEVTVCRMTINKEGQMISIKDGPPKKMIKLKGP